MDAQKRDLERLVRRGDRDAAERLVRTFERRGIGETDAWRWHVRTVETQVASWGEERAQGWLSLALFGLFLERYDVDTVVATGFKCPRRIAGLEHRRLRCVCSGAWRDHVHVFGRGSETPVVHTSQPYQEPEGRPWSMVRNFCARNGLLVDVLPDTDSWHNPGFSRLVVISKAAPGQVLARAGRRRRAVTT